MKTNRLYLMVLMAVFAMVFGACGNGQQANPEQETLAIITENGVGPFLLDSSFLDIPPRGSFYDTILLNRFYTALMDNFVFDEEESNLERDIPYDKIDGCYGTGTVMRDKDTLLVVKYNEHAQIYHVEILSDKFKLSNGIRVGMSSPEIFEKYNARYLDINNFHGRGFHCYDIPNLTNNITILSNHFSGAPDEMVAEIGDSQVFSVSFDNVIDQYVKSILIARDYYNFIHNLNK